MRRSHNTLLAGVAALALIAATGMASAQQNPPDQKGAASAKSHSSMGHSTMQAQPTKQGGAMQHAQSQNQPSSKPGMSAKQASNPDRGTRQSAQQSAKQDSNRRAEDMNRGNGKTSQTAQTHSQNPGHAQSKSASKSAAKPQNQKFGAAQRSKHGQSTAREERMNRSNRTAQEDRINRSNRTAQEEHGRRGRMQAAQRTEHNGKLKGLQANTSIPMQGAHGNVSLSPDQRTTIRRSVIDARGAPRVGRVDFNLRVGTLVPRRHIHVVPVTETLVRIDPQWRGFLYFIVRDEVVIVNPRDMRIVAVLPA